MVTIVSGPRNDDGMSGGAGVVIGAALVVLALLAVIFYAAPYVREQFDAMRNPGNPTINVQLPNPTPAPAPEGTGGTQTQ